MPLLSLESAGGGGTRVAVRFPHINYSCICVSVVLNQNCLAGSWGCKIGVKGLLLADQHSRAHFAFLDGEDYLYDGSDLCGLCDKPNYCFCRGESGI